MSKRGMVAVLKLWSVLLGLSGGLYGISYLVANNHGWAIGLICVAAGLFWTSYAVYQLNK